MFFTFGCRETILCGKLRDCPCILACSNQGPQVRHKIVCRVSGDPQVRAKEGDGRWWGLSERPGARVPCCSVPWRAAQRARDRLAGWRAREVMLMSFKIRMKMFIAEQNLRQRRVLWEGAAVSQPFGFIFAHRFLICWGGC